MKTRIIIFLQELQTFYKNWNTKAITTYVSEKKVPYFISTYLIKEKILIRKNIDESELGLNYQYIFNKEINLSIEEIATSFFSAYKEKTRKYYKERREKNKVENSIPVKTSIFSNDEKFSIMAVLLKNNIPEITVKKFMDL